MRGLSQLSKKKSAVSNIVAYVLLISISIALSVMVYNWLRFYVTDNSVKECPAGTNIIIKSYECYNGSRLYVVLKNKGLFKVDGYKLMVNDRPNSKFGFYTIDKQGVSIMPGKEHTEMFWFNKSINGYKLNTVTLIEVRPFIEANKSKINCKSHTIQKVTCVT